MARCVGSAHDLGEVIESRIFNVVDAQDGVERATLAFVREFDAVDVVGRATDFLGKGHHLARWHVNEFGLRVDETRNQPRASDAVDLRSLARYPFARCLSDLP